MKIDDKGMRKVLYQDVMYQAHYSVDYIDLHEFWSNSSGIPATPPLLATDCDDVLLDLTSEANVLTLVVRYHLQRGDTEP
jgi:hypothetical protein